jgi:hypothetical protein
MTGMTPGAEDEVGELDTGALEALLTRFGGAGPGRRTPAVFPELTTEAYQQAVEQDRAARPYDLLLQLGLGMMASRSPSLFGAIGEAGKTALANVEKTGNQNVRELVQKAQIGGQIAAGEQQRATRQALRTALDADAKLTPAQKQIILADPDGAGRTYLSASMQTPRPSPTVTTAEGVFARNPDGTLGARLGGAPAAPSATVNMPPTETAIMKKNVELLGTAREAISNQGDIIPRLDIIQRLALAGNESGPLTSALLPLRKVLVEVGAFSPEDAEKVSNQQLLASTASFIIPRMRIPGSGASSDLDVRMFTEAVPRLANGPHANLLIAGGMKQIYQRQQQVVDAMERWLADPKNKGALAGFGEWADKNIAPAFPRIPTIGGMEARDKLALGTVYFLEMPDGEQKPAVKR